MIRAFTVLASCIAFGADCASSASVPEERPEIPGVASKATGGTVAVDAAARYWYDPSIPLGHPSADSLRNQNGSPRITDRALYDRFWTELSGTLSAWSADRRIRLNPNFVAALMAKESGFDPQATSAVPAYGIAQMTQIADADLLLITRDAPGWHWMHDEVASWPRVPAVHDFQATKARIDSLVAAGTVNGRVEYLFDPKRSLRGSLFWLRILGHVWTEDQWPGAYATMARARLANGDALSEQDLLALVTVSYNQGHPYAADLVQRYGRDWTAHLNAEASDYLERIGAYTAIFQRASRR